VARSENSQAPICLQERDIALLRGLFESRVMTAGHISQLYFDSRDEATKKRLQKLKAAGLIGERPRRAFEPAALFLTRQGLTPLRERGILQEYPSFDLPALERRARVSPITLRHELEVMDIKAALCTVAEKTGVFSVAEFNTWPLLNEFTAASGVDGDEVLVRPDGFMRIHEKEPDDGLSEHSFFLEVDRSTETQDVLASRAICYLNYYRHGGFAEKSGGQRSQFKDYPFRVLMVFKSAERRNNIAERLIQGTPPILTQVWLTTLSEVTDDPLGAVWVRPIDYRDALDGSAFSRTTKHQQSSYQRQSARELLVEGRVKKHPLITTPGH
jgi:Replication-relaxation